MSPISTFMLFANECSRVRVPFTEHSFSSGAPARWRQNLRNGCRATSTGKSPPLSAITSAPRRWNSSHSYRIVPCHLAVEDVSPFWRNPELPRQFECKKKNRIETEPDPIRHHPVSFKERYKDDDYRMANIFTRRCSSKRVPEIGIVNSLSFETA